MKPNCIAVLVIIISLTRFTHSQVHFGPQQLIDTASPGFVHVHAGDFDGDGDKDIVANCYGKIKCYLNTDGLGTFDSTIIIETNAQGTQCCYAEDLDNDNDLDILADLGRDLDQIVWYENDGNAGFSSKQIITESTDNTHCVYACDIDDDGYNDVLFASVWDGKIAWHRNDGNGGFGNQMVITDQAEGASSVFGADLDGDGDLDVLAGAAWDTALRWFENLDGEGNFGNSNLISSGGTYLQFAYAADLDGDADNDVYSAFFSPGRYGWSRNTGNGIFGISDTIGSQSGATDICAMDLDNDADLDIIGTSDDENLMWYENDGTGVFTEHIISEYNNRSVCSADLNGDGYPDIICASLYGENLTWYENLIFAGLGSNDNDPISIFPNPTNDLINIRCSKSRKNEGLLTIWYMDGSIVLKKHLPKGTNRFTINLVDFKNGFYMCELKIGDDLFTKKIIKK